MSGCSASGFAREFTFLGGSLGCPCLILPVIQLPVNAIQLPRPHQVAATAAIPRGA
jgi:hypothetical protein